MLGPVKPSLIHLMPPLLIPLSSDIIVIIIVIIIVLEIVLKRTGSSMNKFYIDILMLILYHFAIISFLKICRNISGLTKYLTRSGFKMNYHKDSDNFQDISEFYNLIRQIARHIEISRDQLAKKFNLSGAQFHLLYNVSLIGKCNYTELAKHCGLAKNTVSILVKALLKENLLEQIPEPSDGRITLLTLSPKGRELIRKALEEVDTTSSEQLKLLSRRLYSPNGDDISSKLHYILAFWRT